MPTATRRRQGRPSAADGPAVSLEQIVEAGLRVAETDGLDAIQMRRIASDLGVWPTALYHYVGSKDRLLQLVAGAALRTAAPAHLTPETPWQERLLAIRNEWDVFRRYRGVAKFLLTRPALGASSEMMLLLERTLAALDDAGIDETSASTAAVLLSSFLLGLVQYGEEGAESPGPASVDPSQFPGVAHMYGAMIDRDLTEVFLDGLDLLIGGIEARAAQG